MSEMGEIPGRIGDRIETHGKIAGPAPEIWRAHQVELQGEIVRKRRDKLRQENPPLVHRKPLAILAADRLDLAGAVGIPFVGEVAHGVRPKIFYHQHLVTRHKIEFAVCGPRTIRAAGRLSPNATNPTSPPPRWPARPRDTRRYHTPARAGHLRGICFLSFF